jgi:hypothetical protein
MNLLHFAWGVGATICPLLAAGIGLGPSSLPLLYFTICIIGIVCTTPLLFFESPLVDTTSDENDNTDNNGANKTLDEEHGDNIDNGACVSGITLQSSHTADTDNDGENSDTVSDGNKYILQKGLIAMFLYYFSYAGVEGTFGSWLASYVYITGNKIEDGAFAVSVLWGSLTVGRLIASIISKFDHVTPSCYIVVDLLLGTISVIIMIIVASTKVLVMLYFASALIGFSLASMYPMGVTLAGERLSDDSQFTSRYIAGGSFGSLIWPPLVGLLISSNPIAMPIVGLVLLGICSTSVVNIIYCIPSLR